jgi:hypothetical protein
MFHLLSDLSVAGIGLSGESREATPENLRP